MHPPLEFVSATPIDNPVGMSDSAPLEPSGLCLLNGTLLMVSDKHDFVFAIDKGPKSYIPVEWMDLRGMTGPATSDAGSVSRIVSWMNAYWFGANQLELEGVACYNDTAWIASRFHNRIAAITTLGKVLNWTGERAMSVTAGKAMNATYITGVAVNGSTAYIATNNANGELIVDDGITPKAININLKTQTQESQAITDITYDAQGSLWTLSGGQRVVCKIATEDKQNQCWSFLASKLEKDLGYENGTRGMAEGIVISDTEIHIALDNNGEKRLTDATDHRPQLLTFKRPDVRQRP